MLPEQPKQKSLQRRVAFALVGFGLAIAIVVAALSLLEFKQTLNYHLYAHLKSSASVQKGRVETFLDRINERTELIGSRIKLRSLLGEYNQQTSSALLSEIHKLLQDAKHSLPEIKAISIVGPDGVVVASTDARNINREEPTAEKSSWHTVKGERGELLIQVRSPLSLDGATVGYLHVSNSTSELSAITANYDGLGQSGETILAEQMENGDARFLTALRFDANAALSRTIAADRSDIPIIRALSGQTGFHKDIVDYREIPVVAVTTHIPQMDWGLLIKMDQQEVYYSYRVLQIRLLLLLGVIAFSGVVVAYFIANRISRPLKYLTGVANRIRYGQHAVRADVEDQVLDRETTDLALAINGLTDELLQIFNSSPSGMLIADDEGVIVLSNQALDEMFGYERGELVGQSLRKLIPFNYRELYLTGFWKQPESSETQIVEMDQQIRGLKKTGDQIPVELGFSTILQYGQRKVLATAVDISDRINRLRDEEIQKEKDDFFASMSHELRTPLTSIIGNSRYLLDEALTEEQRTIVQSIQMAGENQLLLVNDILDMSKLESGKFSINEAPYDFNQLLQTTYRMLQLRAEDKDLKLVLEQCNEEQCLLMGDAQRVQQILINLLGNAIKFTSRGQVILRSNVSNGHLILTIEDTGIGMSPMVMEKLFKRFEQADGTISRRFGGTGLGLYISLNLVEMMGGELDVSSREGEGSIFQLRLPYQPTTVAVERVQEQSSQVLDPLRFSGEVLVAEDTPLLQQLERRVLEKMGIDVTIAEHGEEAVTQASGHDYDLILMDMQMPMMDGIEATARLRALGVKTPIVAVTANVLQKHKDAFYDAGCDGFLGKPLDENELRGVLQRYLSVETENVAVEEPASPDQPSTSISKPDSMLDELPEEVRTMLQREFYQRMEELRVELQQALGLQSWEQSHDIAHVIKGAGGSYGYSTLTEKAYEVCAAFDNNQFDRMPGLIDILLDEMDQVLD